MRLTKMMKRLHESRMQKAQIAEANRIAKLREARKTLLSAAFVDEVIADQGLANDSRFAKMGEAIANMMKIEMETPSITRLALEHHKKNPTLGYFDCLKAAKVKLDEMYETLYATTKGAELNKMMQQHEAGQLV